MPDREKVARQAREVTAATRKTQEAAEEKTWQISYCFGGQADLAIYEFTEFKDLQELLECGRKEARRYVPADAMSYQIKITAQLCEGRRVVEEGERTINFVRRASTMDDVIAWLVGFDKKKEG